MIFIVKFFFSKVRQSFKPDASSLILSGSLLLESLVLIFFKALVYMFIYGLNIPLSYFSEIFHANIQIWIIMALFSKLVISLLFIDVHLDSFNDGKLIYIRIILQWNLILLSLQNFCVDLKLVRNFWEIEFSNIAILIDHIFN